MEQEQVIKNILDDMAPFLSLAMQVELQKVLIRRIPELQNKKENNAEYDYMKMFLDAKKMEGMSNNTIRNYRLSIAKLEEYYEGASYNATTEDIRSFLIHYQEKNNISKASLDTIRRSLSAYYNWLELEGYIVKSPMRRIRKIKASKVVKKAYTDEEIELMRDSSACIRDLAIIDMLYTTGMRISELISLNREDIDFENRECRVVGKGDKERIVYFDAKTKLHLQEYLSSRTDNNEALFVQLVRPHGRMQVNGIERRLRELGRSLHIDKCHPHKFRTSCATHAISKGMPIEQVKELLGHEDISTTMHYALVNRENVKAAHKKYLS